MRIGLLTTSFPRAPDDIAGAFVLGFARTLVTCGHEVEVLAPEPADTPDAPHDAPPAWPGITVRWVPYLRPRALEQTFYGAGVPDNLQRDPRAWLGLAPFTVALLREATRAAPRWDALVSHWALPCALVAGTVRGTRPHLAVLHSADVHLLARLPLRDRLAARIAAGAHALLFASPALRDTFLGLLAPVPRADAATRCHVSPMGITPPGRPDTPRRTLRRAHALARFTALSLGRLVPVKGVDDAIRAASMLADTTLLVAGDGPERDALARLAARRGADVRLLGLVTGDARDALFAAADAFVLASRVLGSGRTEGTPTALVEAMSAGLPVVATNVGGVGALVTHARNGLLVPPGDPTALAAALGRLRDDAPLRRRLARAGRKTAAQLTWSALAPHLDALVRDD
jgi:glycosyltransferase involved in cell wall biosynthesis